MPISQENLEDINPMTPVYYLGDFLVVMKKMNLEEMKVLRKFEIMIKEHRQKVLNAMDEAILELEKV